jgi:two-component system phosphate regulon sensor histidine kinase PhoR
MKKKNRVLVLGVISIIVIISVQLLILDYIWVEKDVMFDLKYKSLSQEAMEQLNRLNKSDGFENALDLVNRYAEEVMTKEFKNVKNETDLNSLKEDVLKGVTKILNELQNLNSYLQGYFQKQGYESDFNYKIVINSLQLIDFQTKLDVYKSPEFSKDKSSAPNLAELAAAQKSKSRILVNRFFREDNYYVLSFDYYIDFSNKRAMVLRDMSVYFGMSIFSIIVVLAIFLVTYRNLMEERRLSNLKTDFINNMTHELKTPLSTITVAGKTLEMEQIRRDDQKILETAKLIGKQSVHLNQLINLILEISMWERTQFQLDKKTVDIEELLHDIVESFRTGCGNCARINQKYTLEGTKADIDLTYFTTMINNLLTNAVKYSDKDPEISIESYKDKENIYISVADNGIGIDKTDQKHIFDKFYRVSQGNRNIHKTKGLGLGLYYVKRIAESHGGDVTVSSKPGKGSIFTISIPY